jgi:hypothetical protein
VTIITLLLHDVAVAAAVVAVAHDGRYTFC